MCGYGLTGLNEKRRMTAGEDHPRFATASRFLRPPSDPAYAMTSASPLATSAHTLLRVFLDNGVDRVFVVPGESYLGVLDALNDFPEIDVVTCRHESGAAFMAGVDGRITGRPGVAMVSRGPGRRMHPSACTRHS